MWDAVAGNKKFDRVREILQAASDLEHAASLLFWDRETGMPEAASKERASQIATLGKIRHEMLTSDELGELIDDLSQGMDLESLDDIPSLLRVGKRDYEQARKIPSDFVGRFAAARSRAAVAWRKAKEANDFSVFRDDLQHVLDLAIEKAELFGYETTRYDALLDQYEPEMRSETIAAVFDEIKEVLVPLVEGLRGLKAIDAAFLEAPVDRQKLREFGMEVATAMGFDFSRGRLDYVTHPFAAPIGPNDVRITTFEKAEFIGPLMALIHEAGHGIHAQGIPAKYVGTPLWGEPGLGIAESQSRLFEIMVGRSRPFWAHHYPRAQATFPELLGDISLEHFYRAINRVAPSFIRVEADELTYHLHIIIRFELERSLIEQRLSVDDLPDAWNEAMKEYLGIVPEKPAEGVLQDIHWSMGNFGYFPTYSIGSILAAHLMELASRSEPAIQEELAEGRCDALRAWLVEHVYSYGRKLTPPELIKAVTGGPFTPKPFLAYVKQKFGELV